MNQKESLESLYATVNKIKRQYTEETVEDV